MNYPILIIMLIKLIININYAMKDALHVQGQMKQNARDVTIQKNIISKKMIQLHFAMQKMK